MKQYPKTYEDVFTAPRYFSRCKISKVSTDIDLPTDEYVSLLQKTIAGFERSIFDNLVKIYWLYHRFCYRGQHRLKNIGNGWMLDYAFGVFMRRFVGFDNRFLNFGPVFPKLASYLKDFFPDFDIQDPFKERLEYPYKHVTLECLVMVYQMPERLELLQYMEDNRLGYLEFMDYLLNYLYCHNDDVGYQHYNLNVSTHTIMPYVRVARDKIYGGNDKQKIKTSSIRKGKV